MEATAAPELEATLVRRLQQADSSAHVELCRRYGGALHGFAASRLAGDEQLGEEIMVQTLADAVRNIRRFDPRRSSLSAWLYGIARRQIQGERRKQLRRKSIPASAQVSLEALGELGNGVDMAADVAARLDAERMTSELASVLSDLEMEVLVLRCVDEFLVREIGRIIGRSERAAASLLRRAKEKARERVGDDVG